jgi:hypothetical protein
MAARRMAPRMRWRSFAPVALLLVLLALLSSCSNRAATVSSMATADPPALTQATEPRDVSLKLMTYNVLWGGGIDREFDSVVAAKYQTNRLDAILKVIKAAAPDVLAVQEAAGWERGSPSVAARVARELDMHYVVAKDDVNLNGTCNTRRAAIAFTAASTACC